MISGMDDVIMTRKVGRAAIATLSPLVALAKGIMREFPASRASPGREG